MDTWTDVIWTWGWNMYPSCRSAISCDSTAPYGTDTRSGCILDQSRALLFCCVISPPAPTKRTNAVFQCSVWVFQTRIVLASVCTGAQWTVLGERERKRERATDRERERGVKVKHYPSLRTGGSKTAEERKRERVIERGINQPWQISLCRGSSESSKKCWKAKRFAKRYFTLFSCPLRANKRTFRKTSRSQWASLAC